MDRKDGNLKEGAETGVREIMGGSVSKGRELIVRELRGGYPS